MFETIYLQTQDKIWSLNFYLSILSHFFQVTWLVRFGPAKFQYRFLFNPGSTWTVFSTTRPRLFSPRWESEKEAALFPTPEAKPMDERPFRSPSEHTCLILELPSVEVHPAGFSSSEMSYHGWWCKCILQDHECHIQEQRSSKTSDRPGQIKSTEQKTDHWSEILHVNLFFRPS